MPPAPLLGPPNFDRAAAYPEVGFLRRAAAAHDWQTIRGFVAGMPHGSDRSIVPSVVSEVDGVELQLREMVAAAPGDAVALMLLGAREVHLGWEVRTAARAERVSAEQFAAFREHLVAAERLLIRATALDPWQDGAWAERLNTARGLQLGQNEARRRYDQLAKYSPGHFTGQARLLQQLCPKWGGDWESLHDFARTAMFGSPGGSLNAGLVAEAHVEHWIALPEPERAAYLRQPHVHRELVEAAEHSVMDPRFTPTYGWVTVQGAFALLFFRIGDRERSAAHFRALAGLASPYPWDLLGRAATVYDSIRTAVLTRD